MSDANLLQPRFCSGFVHDFFRRGRPTCIPPFILLMVVCIILHVSHSLLLMVVCIILHVSHSLLLMVALQMEILRNPIISGDMERWGFSLRYANRSIRSVHHFIDFIKGLKFRSVTRSCHSSPTSPLAYPHFTTHNYSFQFVVTRFSRRTSSYFSLR